MSRRFHLSFALILTLVPHAFADGASSVSSQNASTNLSLFLNPLRQISKERLTSFVQAPLFDPARRLPIPAAMIPLPQPPPPAPVVILEDPPPNLHLLGVLQGDRDIAIIRDGDDPKTSTVSSGDHIKEWTVTILTTPGIQLSNGPRVFEYLLFAKPRNSEIPAAAAPETASFVAPGKRTTKNK
jgi:hypothetical protein